MDHSSHSHSSMDVNNRHLHIFSSSHHLNSCPLNQPSVLQVCLNTPIANPFRLHSSFNPLSIKPSHSSKMGPRSFRMDHHIFKTVLLCTSRPGLFKMDRLSPLAQVLHHPFNTANFRLRGPIPRHNITVCHNDRAACLRRQVYPKGLLSPHRLSMLSKCNRCIKARF